MLSRIHTLLLLFTVTLFAPACSEPPAPSGTPFSAVEALAADTPDHRIAYGTQPSQFVELWLPPATAALPPVIVLIHGGCWLSAFGVDHIRPMAAALSDAGFAVWAPEYRRVGEPGGGDPGTLQDMGAMLAALTSKSPVPLDTDRVILVGHSAGGHLALWTAAQQGSPAAAATAGPRVLGAVGLAAITDLASYAVLPGSCPPATLEFVGAAPAADPDRYRALSPAALVMPVPIVLLQGEWDRIVPLAQAEAMPEARLHHVPQAGHFDLIYPPAPAFALLLRVLEDLLDV
jgi:acetyl esterase/lipase